MCIEETRGEGVDITDSTWIPIKTAEQVKSALSENSNTATGADKLSLTLHYCVQSILKSPTPNTCFDYKPLRQSMESGEYPER